MCQYNRLCFSMLYAAYGSNLHPVRLKLRTPMVQLLGTAVLPDMSLHFHKRGYQDDSGKCNIMPCGDAAASKGNHGVYLAIYDISRADLALLDQHEGAGAGYDRTLINIDGFGDCVTYLATLTHIDDTLLPFSWYKELVLVGCEKLAFPERYINAIRTVPALQDANCDRHNFHMDLVKKARNDAFIYSGDIT